MRVITAPDDLDKFLSKLRRRGRGVSPSIEKVVGGIMSSVRRQGDKALKKYTEAFDGHENLVVRPDAVRRHSNRAGKDVVRALKVSAERIRLFHKRQKEKTWTYESGGIRLGQIIRPLERVGVYVPGGKASYPSTVLMNVIPAQIAGVKEIAVTVPTPGGEINPDVMAALNLLGVKEVYAVGGAQAVAALAYGTKTIKKVDKIVGPGNVYVATAKKMVFGEVDIDMIAGPSEVLIIADGKASPAFAASDLLSQAEHDELASSIVVTDSHRFAEELIKQLKGQLSALKRKEIATKSLAAYGAVIMVGDIKEAARIANIIAPEHIEIMTVKPVKLLPLIKNAGAVFLGPWSPEPVGDYSAGPNHTLPTGGTARFFSPLGVYDFVKRTSLLQLSRKGFLSLAGVVQRLAEAEGLDAHANSVGIRRR